MQLSIFLYAYLSIYRSIFLCVTRDRFEHSRKNDMCFPYKTWDQVKATITYMYICIYITCTWPSLHLWSFTWELIALQITTKIVPQVEPIKWLNFHFFNTFMCWNQLLQLKDLCEPAVSSTWECQASWLQLAHKNKTVLLRRIVFCIYNTHVFLW